MLVLEEKSQPRSSRGMCACEQPSALRGWQWVVLCLTSPALGAGCCAELRRAACWHADSHRLARPRGGSARCGSSGCAGLEAAGLCRMRGRATLLRAASCAHHR